MAERGERVKLRRARIRELVRQFKENGMKLMLEQPGNVQDLLTLVELTWIEEIDFPHLRQIKTTFIRRNYRHLESDVVFTVPLVGRPKPAKELLIYILIEHQSQRDRWMPLRLADAQIQIYRYQVRRWLQTHTSLVRARLSPVLPLVFYTGVKSWPDVGTLVDLIERGDEFRSVTPVVERPLLVNLPQMPAARLSATGATSAGCCGWYSSVRRVPLSSRVCCGGS